MANNKSKDPIQLRQIPLLNISSTQLKHLIDVLNCETDLKHQHMVIQIMSSLSYVPQNLIVLLKILNEKVKTETKTALLKLQQYENKITTKEDCNALLLSEHDRASKSRVTDSYLYGYVHALSLNATIHGVSSSLHILSETISLLTPSITNCLEKLRNIFPNVDGNGNENDAKSTSNSDSKNSKSSTNSSTNSSSSSSNSDDSSSASSSSIVGKRKRSNSSLVLDGDGSTSKSVTTGLEKDGSLLETSIESHVIVRFSKLIESMFKIGTSKIEKSKCSKLLHYDRL